MGASAGCPAYWDTRQFRGLRGDSLLALRLLAQIEEVYDRRLPMSVMLDTTTIEQLAALLCHADAQDRQDRLVYAASVQARDEGSIFFLVGASFLLLPLSRELGSDQRVFSIGIDPRAVEHLNIPYRTEELAGHLIEALREKQPEGPYYLGGFCQHAVFAYEVARQLTTSGQTVGLLVLFEPHNPHRNTRIRIETGLRRMRARVSFRFHQLRSVGISGFPAHALKRWENVKLSSTYILKREIARLKIRKGQSSSLDLDQVLSLAMTSYNPRPLGCPTVIFRANDWPIGAAGDPYFGWRELLTGLCETYLVPGDHAGMFSEPNVRVLADQLRALLHRAKPTQSFTYQQMMV